MKTLLNMTINTYFFVFRNKEIFLSYYDKNKQKYARLSKYEKIIDFCHV